MSKQVILTGYVYKPSSREVDQLRHVVDGMREAGLDANISKLYEALARKAINNYNDDPRDFFTDISFYLKTKTRSRSS